MLRNLAAVLLLALACIASSPAAHAGIATDPVVLTVTGNVAKPNRGPIDPFQDAVLAHLDAKFDKGFTFSLEDLRALPQVTVTARYPEWPRDVTAKGPELGAVLKAATAEGKKIVVQGVDGYAPEFTAEDVARGKMILALEADGAPLNLGGRGPLWLFGPKDSFTGQEADEGFVYAVIRIDVQ